MSGACIDLTFSDEDDDQARHRSAIAPANDDGSDALRDINQEMVQLDGRLSVLNLEIRERERKKRQLELRIEELKKQKSLIERKENMKAFLVPAQDFPWSQQLFEQMQSVFHNSVFRPLQKEAIDCSLSGKDCVVLLPAGSGKSLCYQLPSMLRKGVTIVVSPLIALMHDQTMQMQKLNIKAGQMHEAIPKEAIKLMLKAMEEGHLDLLFVTPERIVSSKTLQNAMSRAYRNGLLGHFAVDEAHCCSEWGHDFRPAYRKLGIIRNLCPDTPIMALTATAAPKTVADVRKVLMLHESAPEFRLSCDRSNLIYECRPKPSPKLVVQEVIDLLLHDDRFQGQSAIVYSLSQKNCEDISKSLHKAGVKAGAYHAGLTHAQKNRVFEQWQDGILQVVVATIAFGMGVSKLDVRLVVHETMSKSLAGYYQESARAGRDMEPATCILYYSPNDSTRLAAMAVSSPNSGEHLREMMEFCQDLRTCRHQLLAKAFGEYLENSCESFCDNCLKMHELKQQDVTEEALALFRFLKTKRGRKDRLPTLAQAAKSWRGIGGGVLFPPSVRLDEKKFSNADAERVLISLFIKGILEFRFVATSYNTIAYVGAKASMGSQRLVIFEEERILVDLFAKKMRGSSSRKSAAPSRKKQRTKLHMSNVDSRMEDDTTERNAAVDAAMDKDLSYDSRPTQSLLDRHRSKVSKTIEEQSDSLDEFSDFDDFVE